MAGVAFAPIYEELLLFVEFSLYELSPPLRNIWFLLRVFSTLYPPVSAADVPGLIIYFWSCDF